MIVKLPLGVAYSREAKFCLSTIFLSGLYILQFKTTHMKEKSVSELKAMIDSGEDFQLIDVREPHEYDICNINGLLIPVNQVPDNIDKISKDKTVVVHCRSGARSGNAIRYLEESHGYQNLYNLRGGILAWADEIDPDMPKY